MTVKELIEALQRCCNQDSEVVYYDPYLHKYISLNSVIEKGADMVHIYHKIYENGDFLFRTALKDIEEDRLIDILETHKQILGLE
jgi:murein tripeptide amidase MpaA